MLGGPRTVRTDLFAAIALPVLTLFVLLYTASLLAVMHPSCGRLGCAVAVGIGNTLGSGETGRKCMFISPGVATRGLTGVQCGIRNDHNVVCTRMRCIVTTISRGRNRLWPSGLQYNARRMQIAWTSSSLCTGILAGRCSAICRRQLTNTKRKIKIDWCPDHVVCRTRSAHAVTPSGMLFSEQKSQEFCSPYLDIGPPTSFQAAALASRRTRLRPPPPQAPPSNTEACAGASETLPLRLCVGR